MGPSVAADWFARPSPRAEARSLLYCLPYAGAGANAFRSWSDAFGAQVDVVGVRLPGRESRVHETPQVDIRSVAEAITVDADRPFGLYGHSLGARLGFEITRLLRDEGGPLPVMLGVGASRPPHQHLDDLRELSTLPDEQLVERLRTLGGTPAEVLAQPELLELLLPVFRADFGWLDRYRYRPAPPLPVPISAFCGDRDPMASPEQMAEWRCHTNGGFALHTLPGDHFFLHQRRAELAALITSALR